MSETFRNFSGKIPETFGAWRGLGIGIIINDSIYDRNTFIAYWAAASCSLLGNNQRNELHSVIFTALQTKVTRLALKYVSKCGHCSKNYEGVYWQVLFSAELFRKSTVIFPEISGKKSAGNFRTHNPSHGINSLRMLMLCRNDLHISLNFS